MQTYDLVVVGGGLTGVAAAVAAARQGLDVLLCEQSGFLGGALGNCLINPFMNNGTNLVVDGEKKRVELSQGILPKSSRNSSAWARSRAICSMRNT